MFAATLSLVIPFYSGARTSCESQVSVTYAVIGRNSRVPRSIRQVENARYNGYNKSVSLCVPPSNSDGVYPSALGQGEFDGSVEANPAAVP